MHKSVDVLKTLSIHPEVIRRRNYFLNTVLAIKTSAPKIRFFADGFGWSAHRPGMFRSEDPVAMGVWTTEAEKYNMLEDSHFGVDSCVTLIPRKGNV